MAFEKHTVFVHPSADQRFADHINFMARVSENAAVQLYEAYEKALYLSCEQPGELSTLHAANAN